MNLADMLFEAGRDFEQTERCTLSIAVANRIQQTLVFGNLLA